MAARKTGQSKPTTGRGRRTLTDREQRICNTVLALMVAAVRSRKGA